MALPAPGRLSTMTGWPMASGSFCAMRRAGVSVAPPGENGMIIRIGRAG